MATQTIEFPASTGRTLTAKVYPVGSDTATATAGATTEATNRKGIYAATFTNLAGDYLLVALDGSSIPACVDPVAGVTNTTTTYQTNSIRANAPMQSTVKKNQALASFEFLMTDSTNHNPLTGLTVTVTRSIDGGAFAGGTLSSVTEVSAGIYKVDFAAADLNGNVVILRATATGADDRFERIITDP